MTAIDKIFENNEKWVTEKLSLDPNYFENLSKGQAPEFLYIGCSDSRVTAEDLMGAKPGEIFIHRNIANESCYATYRLRHFKSMAEKHQRCVPTASDRTGFHHR